MLLLIIILPVLLQYLAQCHRTGHEQQVGGNDDHYDSHEKQRKSRQRCFDGHGKIVGDAQNDDTQYGKDPIGLGRLFTEVFTAQQLQRLTAPDLPQGFDREQQKDDAEDDESIGNGLGRDGEAVVDCAVNGVEKAQLCQLGEYNAKSHAADQAECGYNQRFPENNTADAVFIHAEDVEQAKLLIASADQERIGIEKEQQRKDGNDKFAEGEDHFKTAAALFHFMQQRRIGQKVDDVEHHDHAHTTEYIREIQLAIFYDAAPSQAGIDRLFHRLSPPACSMVRVSEIF